MLELTDKDLIIGDIQLVKRPAVLVVDMSNGFAEPSSPLGGDFSHEINVNVKLCNVAKQHNLPIFFTTVVYDNDKQASVFRQRLPALNILKRGSDWVRIHKQLESFVEDEFLIEKHYPSAFFNTNLAKKLNAENVDSLIITGLTTSGCVRASCVDGLQHNYPCAVVLEACGDRNSEAHNMSMHDMHAKYAQVLNLDDTITWIQSTC